MYILNKYIFCFMVFIVLHLSFFILIKTLRGFQVYSSIMNRSDNGKHVREKITEIITILLEYGANPNTENNEGLTPLHYAVKANSSCTIKQLAAAGANLNHESLKKSGTLLDFAIHHSHPKTVSLLLSLGSDIQKADRYGRTPFHTAASCGKVDMMELLLAKGAKFDVEDLQGTTPIHLASWYGKKEAVAWLLKKGVPPGVRDKHLGWTPLHFAADWNRVETAEVLLHHSADINAADCRQHTPLYYANYCQHTSMSKFLTSLGGIDA